MKFIVIALAVIALAGCSKTIPVDQSRFIVIDPPSTLMQCPYVNIPNDAATMTNYDLAQLVERFYRVNRTCAINMQQIRDFVQVSKESIVNVD